MPPPTVTSVNAAQSQAGPNAILQINLFTQASGQFGGWGTYEFLIQASSGASGGFCFLVQLSNSNPGSAPACSAALSSGFAPAPAMPAGAPSGLTLSGFLGGAFIPFFGLVVSTDRNLDEERTFRTP